MLRAVQVSGSDTPVLQCVLDSDGELQGLVKEEIRLQKQLESLEDPSTGPRSVAASADTEVSSVSVAPEPIMPASSEELSKRLTEVTNLLSMLEATSAESRASTILSGLQFTSEMMAMPTSALSGGWRMR